MNVLSVEVQSKINSVLNQPWTHNGQHCWKLVREVISILGYELPPIIDVVPGGREGRLLRMDLFGNHPELANWKIVKDPPSYWGLALMHRTFRSAKAIEHSGVYFGENGGRVLHTSDPHGVVYDTMGELRLRNWVPIFLVPKLGNHGYTSDT